MTQANKLVFTESARKELKRLQGDVKEQAKKQIKKICANPEIGVPLGNKGGYNLTGCYKKEFYKHKQYRIVYRVDRNTVTIVIIAIGKRDKFAVYEMAHRLIEKNREREG